jgi:hypothetical protein
MRRKSASMAILNVTAILFALNSAEITFKPIKPRKRAPVVMSV